MLYPKLAMHDSDNHSLSCDLTCDYPLPQKLSIHPQPSPNTHTYTHTHTHTLTHTHIHTHTHTHTHTCTQHKRAVRQTGRFQLLELLNCTEMVPRGPSS